MQFYVITMAGYAPPKLMQAVQNHIYTITITASDETQALGAGAKHWKERFPDVPLQNWHIMDCSDSAREFAHCLDTPDA